MSLTLSDLCRLVKDSRAAEASRMMRTPMLCGSVALSLSMEAQSRRDHGAPSADVCCLCSTEYCEGIPHSYIYRKTYTLAKFMALTGSGMWLEAFAKP